MVFDIGGGGSLMVMLIAASHPDVADMAQGPLSPPLEQLTAAPAHYIVTALGLEGSDAQKDSRMAALTATVLAGCRPAGVMLGHGILFHNPDLFADLALSAAEHDELPVEICVDVTVARESEDRMSMLSHNMTRYGREEFFVIAPIEGKGALDFLLSMVRWMIADPDKHLPTGDTVGRTAEEKITVERVPNPTGEGPEVIQLVLP
jgi:hypothetical protein